jgi:hypothetical protein
LFNSLAHFLDLGVDEVRAGDHVRQAVANEILRNDMLDRDWAITIMDYVKQGDLKNPGFGGSKCEFECECKPRYHHHHHHHHHNHHHNHQ